MTDYDIALCPMIQVHLCMNRVLVVFDQEQGIEKSLQMGRQRESPRKQLYQAFDRQTQTIAVIFCLSILSIFKIIIFFSYQMIFLQI